MLISRLYEHVLQKQLNVVSNAVSDNTVVRKCKWRGRGR
jgi:hypothetical protein